jgi:hypothetical protein
MARRECGELVGTNKSLCVPKKNDLCVQIRFLCRYLLVFADVAFYMIWSIPPYSRVLYY